MNAEVFKDTRLLEALELIDDKYIADAARYNMDYVPRVNEEPVRTWKTPFKYWKQFVALAACVVLLAFSAPIVGYISEVISNFRAGAGSGTTEEMSDISESESKALHELFPDYTPAPLSEERIAELAELLPMLVDPDEWQRYQFFTWYLGDFNGCLCYFSDGQLDWVETKIIAGYEFTRGSSFTLEAIYNGERMQMIDAYERGYLTQDEVGMMAAYHARIMNDMVAFNPPETTTPLYRLFPDYVPEPLDSSKKEAIEALMGGNTSWYHENQKNFYGIQYLGTFGECIVLSRRGEGRLKPRNIAGYDFYVSDGADIVVYFDNEIIDLEDAYNLGLISKENIGMAACLHDRLRRGSGYKKDWILETNN